MNIKKLAYSGLILLILALVGIFFLIFQRPNTELYSKGEPVSGTSTNTGVIAQHKAPIPLLENSPTLSLLNDSQSTEVEIRSNITEINPVPTEHKNIIVSSFIYTCLVGIILILIGGSIEIVCHLFKGITPPRFIGHIKSLFRKSPPPPPPPSPFPFMYTTSLVTGAFNRTAEKTMEIWNSVIVDTIWHKIVACYSVMAFVGRVFFWPLIFNYQWILTLLFEPVTKDTPTTDDLSPIRYFRFKPTQHPKVLFITGVIFFCQCYLYYIILRPFVLFILNIFMVISSIFSFILGSTRPR